VLQNRFFSIKETIIGFSSIFPPFFLDLYPGGEAFLSSLFAEN
tara:strand:- start:353 stop:481 length:129 start_codon:yes stop_codon:yes gene_type:complete